MYVCCMNASSKNGEDSREWCWWYRVCYRVGHCMCDVVTKPGLIRNEEPGCRPPDMLQTLEQIAQLSSASEGATIHDIESWHVRDRTWKPLTTPGHYNISQVRSST